MPFQFTTDDYPPSERRDVWHDIASRVCCPLSIEFGFDDELFHGTVEHRRVADLDLVRVEQNSPLARRSRREINRADPNSYYLIVQIAGRSRIAQGADEAVLNAGEMTLVDTGRPTLYSFAGESINLNLHIPHRVLDSRAGAHRVPLARTIGGGIAMITIELMRSAFLYSQGADADADAGVDEGVREALLSLVVSSIGGGRGGREPPDDTALVRAMQSFIDAHLADDHLSPTAVAQAHGISVRHLQRLFKSQGTTLVDWVRLRRLQRCAEELRDPRFGGASITEISYRWGFNDSAYFSRAFKSTFGIPPREYRRA
jgi:AraC family transcriptional activator of tynA and feaB